MRRLRLARGQHGVTLCPTGWQHAAKTAMQALRRLVLISIRAIGAALIIGRIIPAIQPTICQLAQANGRHVVLRWADVLLVVVSGGVRHGVGRQARIPVLAARYGVARSTRQR